MTAIQVAGRVVESPLDVVSGYAERYARTVREYDLAQADCPPNHACMQEVKRTRVIASRISNEQGTAMLRVLADAPWSRVPESAHLDQADPEIRGELYDHMLDLYLPLLDIPGVSHAKASKLLHLKRPALFPILDSKLMALYRRPAAEAAKRHAQLGHRRLYWAACREDVIANREPLDGLRTELEDQEGLLKKMAALSDIRLLDILAWKV